MDNAPIDIDEIPSTARSDTPSELRAPSHMYRWVLNLTHWRAALFAFALGLLGNLAFPPMWIWPALCIALCGLLWLIDGAQTTQRPLRAVFVRVFAFGFGYFLASLHWIAAAFTVDAQQYIALVWLPLIILPGGLALILATIMSFGARFWCPGPARLIVFVVSFTFAEWFRGSLFGVGGLPWNLPGMVWEPGGAISQSASLWGIYGLSLITVAALATPAIVTDTRPRGTLGSRVAPVLAAAVVFGALWGWGERRLATAPTEATQTTVRMVSAGTPQKEKYEPGAAERMLQRYLALTGPDTTDTPPIVIWPEGALPYFLFEWPQGLAAVTERIGNRRLVIGASRREFITDQDQAAYNSLAVLSGDSAVRGPLQIYDKHRLVPFGEFVPGGDLLKSVGLETLQDLAPGGWDAGPPPASINVAGMPAFGPLICYEAIFPGLSPSNADRPEWLVNVSNDAWFGNLIGPDQHAAQARYRAIEDGLPMARVAAGGHTGMIDAFGRWTAREQNSVPETHGPDPEGWEGKWIDAPIPIALEPTPFSNWRNGLFFVMLAMFNLGLLVLPRR